jgi:hypothetical protein
MNGNRVNLSPIEVSDPSILLRIYKLRVDSWLSIGLSQDVFPSGLGKDIHDEHSRHWAIIDGEDILAAARMCIHQSMSEMPSSHIYDGLDFDALPPIASINWLVIHPDARGLGLSSKLDYVRLKAASDYGCRSVIGYCSELSGKARRSSLVKQGFRIVSPINFRADWCEADLVTAMLLTFSG